jgi:holo-[acyl-carrier protein] synthase
MQFANLIIFSLLSINSWYGNSQICWFLLNLKAMVTGVGIDMIEVDRLKESMKKEVGFREMVFSEKEIAYCQPKVNRFEHYAARYAAKEAFFKAIGTGWLDGTAFNEVEIINLPNGKPTIGFLGLTADTIKRLKLKNIQVSLTHLKTIASAVVIIEK